MANNIGEIALSVYRHEVDLPTLIEGFAKELTETINFENLPMEIIDPTKLFYFQKNEQISTCISTFDRFGNRITKLQDEVVEKFSIEGGTLIFVDVNDRHPAFSKYAAELTAKIPGRVWINLFLTSHQDGMRAHWDDNDVFVIQLSGDRKWEFWEPDPVLPIASSPQLKTDPDKPASISMNVKPGDLVVVPRGWIHKASLGESTSTHLMIAYRCPTVFDYLLNILNKASRTTSAWRQNVSMDEKLRSTQIQEALKELKRISTSDDEIIHDLLRDYRESNITPLLTSLLDNNP